MRASILWAPWVALLLAASPASAGIYKWTDDSGNVHYTSDPMKVPQRYRGRDPEPPGAKATRREHEETAKATERPQPAPAPPARAAGEEPPGSGR